ncbi:hypothetical protein KY495_08895 [Massilia sp. PAMC28688]|uniref:hypothetical protein n=1 Tax=Massilia sp. PAMC28688 TaxID=2861283 RepID=UPI001C62CD81|nr:hypothetical protein [Massilia sp. PAMC28688]QYF95250.1 hypothetical protein KY495_08895 [Massilia sp. PAMC28688]
MEFNRIVSWLCMFLAVALLIVSSGGSSASACRNAGCVGAGLGEAIVLIAAEILLVLVATVFATRAFNRIDGTPSTLRIIELWIFRLPMIGAMLMLLSIVFTIAS